MYTPRQIIRIIRVLRLLAVVQAYHHYTMMQMNHKLLKSDNSWEDAEKLSDLMNIFFPHTEHSPTDFLHNKDEVTDEILNYYDDLKMWTKLAEKVGISEKTLTAFCKNVDNFDSIIHLKALGHIYYPGWIMAFFLYLNNNITKKELQNTFVEFNMFSGKPKPANFAKFRKIILQIENKIAEITIKQYIRKSTIK